MNPRLCLLLMVPLLAVCLGRAMQKGTAGEKPSKRTILIVGFGPFGERAVNGSSLAAKAVAEESESTRVVSLEVPVVWGEPKRALAPILEREKPEVLICLGEGYPGFFTIESVARNARGEIKDVSGNLPPTPSNEKDGPGEIRASAPVIDIAKALTEKGFSTHVSTDAGRYLCEEMLYTIERLKQENPSLKLVLFSHIPPQGQATILNGKVQPMTPKLAAAYARALLDVTREIVEKQP